SGIGFYDYRRFRIMHRPGYWGEDWQATTEGKVLQQDYERQPGPRTGKGRQGWEYVVAVHAGNMSGKALKLFTDYEFETVHSNYGIEEYSVSTVVAGVDWEF